MYNLCEVYHLRNLMLDGLSEFCREIIIRDRLGKISDSLCMAWFNWQCGKGSIEEVKQALLSWHQEQIKIIEGLKKDIPEDIETPKGRIYILGEGFVGI